MTEKHYGGNSSFGFKDKSSNNSNTKISNIKNSKSEIKENPQENTDLANEEIESLKKAGKISSELKKYARSIIKPGMPLLEIANKIEDKIIQLGAKPAFPINLSINEIAAHDTPSWNDTRTAQGLLKVDLGIHINGFVADTAFSLDLENNEENRSLIKAAELALEKATKTIEIGVPLNKIGIEVEKAISSLGFQPIQNLSGHSIEQYTLHAGITIPNVSNSSPKPIQEGVYAIEPFSTNGLGLVKDGKPSGIYKIENPSNVRDNFAREVLNYLIEEYDSLPFCSRWIHKKFGSRGLLALRQIEQARILHQYPQLIESGKGKVAQAEHTIVLTNKEKIITTL